MQSQRLLVSTLLTATLGSGALCATVSAQQLQMEVALANPKLQAGKKNTTYLKVGLTGFEFPNQEDRPPVNVALVIDRSSSMGGEKIVQARKAATMAIERLQPSDIVSVIAYDNSVEVLAPATKLTDKAQVLRCIEELTPRGSTALFAGVSKGAAELRKFLAEERVNRVILLSDGQANVGPQSPGELGELGASLVKEGISVSTIGLGLGYNEDLMAKLAFKSDGNHIFVEDESQLVAIFNEEFGDILSVAAQEVLVRIECAPGIRPVRTLGRESDISGQSVITTINQIYSRQEKFVILEIEVPEGKTNSARDVASVSVSYANMLTRTPDELTSKLAVRFVPGEDAVAESINRKVMSQSILLVATGENERAVKLRDAGKVEEASQVLTENWGYLNANAQALDSEELAEYAEKNRGDAEAVKEADWARSRKIMVQDAYVNKAQLKSELKTAR
ncbi:MAG: VWA domain-containing protein [Verrucomicrobiota bacterium]